MKKFAVLKNTMEGLGKKSFEKYVPDGINFG